MTSKREELKKEMAKAENDLESIRLLTREFGQQEGQVMAIFQREKELLAEIDYYSAGSEAARFAQRDLEQNFEEERLFQRQVKQLREDMEKFKKKATEKLDSAEKNWREMLKAELDE